MGRDRFIQLIALIVAVMAFSASAVILPTVVHFSEYHVLRYTNVAADGAPPWIAVGQAIGALRGLIVDIYWIKANAMKEKGLYYEAMADAEIITRLQPRFPAVWAFHGHNMAYNISVATHTQSERWEWVNAGIRLVRNEGIRYNPNDLRLHKDLSWWFAHKIEGVADDAHFYYKRALCHEWHMLLGPPPESHEERIEWMRDIADAPDNLADAQRRTPALVQLLRALEELSSTGPGARKFKLDREFIRQYVELQEIKQRSAAAKILGLEEAVRQRYPAFDAFDRLASDPQYQEAWKTLIAHARKRVLKDEYNMDPALMLKYTKELGPLDWRHGQAHSLYWARRGDEFGRGRLSSEDLYVSLNNDSQQMQAMQDMARFGRISYDPFSNELPGRFPDPRWIDTIDKLFDHFYVKHENIPGAGGERFINFLKNFMGSAVREAYRGGERDRADRMLKRLDSLFGSGLTATYEYKMDIEAFVWEQTWDQLQAQPHIAPSEIAASLRYGFKVGILYNRPEVLRDALLFSAKVTQFFKENHWNEYTNKFGYGRIADIIGDLEDSAEIAYLQMIIDPTISLTDRMDIWNRTDRIESDVIRQAPMLLNRPAPALRALVYDRAMSVLAQQFAMHELSRALKLEEAFTPPPGLEQARQALQRREEQRERQREELRQRDEIMRR